MKILLLILILANSLPIGYTRASNVAYARINSYNVYLYRSPVADESFDNLYFAIDRTYFVQITDSANDDFYCANYNGISGYVKKSQVNFVLNKPTTPYVTGKTFRVYGDQSRSLRNEPSDKKGADSLIEYLPLYTTNLTYIGSIAGDEVISERTNVWYFCRYSGETTKYGYIYSDMCDQMSTILLNTESCEYINEPAWLSTAVSSQKLTQKNTNIVIGILAVPTIIITFLLLAGHKILSKANSTKAHKKEISEF